MIKTLQHSVILVYNEYMNTEKRREKIIEILRGKKEPISASTLANSLSVSRQVIVGDVAILRAENHDIEATPRGYILNSKYKFPYTGIVACKHGKEETEEELNTIVDFGGTCIDVSVDHPFFGEITGNLSIKSRYDVSIFIKHLDSDSKPLSSLSYDGVHLHKIGCPDKESFERIYNALNEKGLIFKE